MQPFAGIASEVKRKTPRVLINKDIVGPFARSWQRRPNDVILKGDVVSRLTDLIKLLGWEEMAKTLLDTANKEWKERQNAPAATASEKSTDVVKRSGDENYKEKGFTSKNDGRKSFHTLAGVQVKRRTHASKYAVKNEVNANASNYVASSFEGNTNTTPLPCGFQNTQIPSSSNEAAKPLFSSSNKFKGMITLPKYSPDSPSTSRKFSLLPFIHRQPNQSETKDLNNYRTIDPYKDLASAGFQLGRRTKRGSLRCFSAHGSEID